MVCKGAVFQKVENMAENNEEAPWGTTHSSEMAIMREGRLKDRMVWMLGIHWSAGSRMLNTVAGEECCGNTYCMTSPGVWSNRTQWAVHFQLNN